MLKNRVVRAVGAMSGTSLDGIDVAELLTDGERIHGFGETGYRIYSAQERELIRSAFGRWPGDDVEIAGQLVETAHSDTLKLFDLADVIGFHGQTVAHDPTGRGTHQLGDGKILAEALNKPVVWDFRTSDVELGGQGAPLAPFYHFALAKYLGETAPVVFLNLGGVGNLTWVDPSKERPDEDGALLAFDTGPANAPINDLMQVRLGKPHDENGALAKGGHVHEDIVAELLAHPYFYKMPPKSLDRNAFPKLTKAVAALSDADAAATLTATCALTVSEGLRHCPTSPTKVLVSGGGRHNATLMEMLKVSIDVPVMAVEEVDLDGDMIEAQAFAFLAVRVLNGLPTSCPSTTGVRAAVSGGTLSVPRN